MKTIIDAGQSPQSPKTTKKPEPPTIEQLQQQLATLKIKHGYELEYYKQAQEQLQSTNKEIEDLECQVANLKYKNVNPKNIDWKDLLMANMGQGRYNLMNQKWYEMWKDYGLKPDGYIPETGQYTLQFHLQQKNCTTKYLKAMEQLLTFIIPFLIPHNNYIHFNICDPGLSEFTSYDVHYNNTQEWILMQGRNSKQEQFRTNNTMTMLLYLAKHHSHN